MRLFTTLALALLLLGCGPHRREAFLAAHPDLEPHIAEQIADGRLSMGMTTQHVRASWGDPRKVNRTVGENGQIREQWIYGRDRYAHGRPVSKSTYLYFRNGKLVSWQD